MLISLIDNMISGADEPSASTRGLLLKNRLLGLRVEPPETGVPRPSGPEIPTRSVKKVPKKSQKDLQKSQKCVKINVWGLFGHFFDTPGGEALEDPFETFWGFRGSGVWRLLYMGIAIIILECRCNICVYGSFLLTVELLCLQLFAYPGNSLFCLQSVVLGGFCLLPLDGPNRQSPIASVQRTRSTLAGHSAGPCGTNTAPTKANRAIPIATQRT